MTVLELMKADADACNKRARQNWGVVEFPTGQSGYSKRQSDKLMPRRENVLALFEAGLSTAEIADMTGLTRSTVKSDLSIARRQIQEAA